MSTRKIETTSSVLSPTDGKIERCICLTMPDTDVVEEDAVTTPTSRFVFDEVPEDSFTEYAFAM